MCTPYVQNNKITLELVSNCIYLFQNEFISQVYNIPGANHHYKAAYHSISITSLLAALLINPLMTDHNRHWLN
jgi:hypothetical protein